MTSLFYLLGGLLFLLILFLIFRISHLLDALREEPLDHATDGSEKWNGLLFIVFGIVGFWWFFSYTITEADRYLIPLASEHGVVLDEMVWITAILTLIVFLLTHILLFFFSYWYRYRRGARAYFYSNNHRLELVWTIIPAIVLAVLVFNGWRSWVSITSPAPEDAKVIEIVGYQFAWAARYPGKDERLGGSDYRLIDAANRIGVDFSDEAAQDDFLAREIRLPKGQPIQFKIRGLDVIHSVYAPHFRLQMYAVPGMPTTFWFTPTKTTEDMREELGDPEFNYELACNKICGRGHFAMRYTIVVEEPAAYERWYQSQASWLSKNPEYAQKLRPPKLRREDTERAWTSKP